MTDDTLDKAYQACLTVARQHYENFPTAARLLSGKHRAATAAIYAFARGADDIADEGDLSATARHKKLDQYAAQLERIARGETSQDPVFTALADSINRYNLPLEPFHKLLQAFRQDIDTRRYASFAKLCEYCAHSANPVGELILRLHGLWNDTNQQYSERICTALQLINFMQDIDSDFHQRGRIYIPLEEMHQYGVTELQFDTRQQNSALEQLIAMQLQRARQMLQAGIPLLAQCPFRLRLVLQITVASAGRILEKLEKRQNVFARPILTRGDFATITLRSLLLRRIIRS